MSKNALIVAIVFTSMLVKSAETTALLAHVNSVDQKEPTADCRDEKGGRYSNGALRKVGGQIQKCDAKLGWIASATADRPLAVDTKRAKACKGDYGQMYQAGLLRTVKDEFQRCDNGSWKAEKPKS